MKKGPDAETDGTIEEPRVINDGSQSGDYDQTPPSQSIVVPSGTKAEAPVHCTPGPAHDYERIEEQQACFRHEIANILGIIGMAIELIRKEINAIIALEPIMDERSSMLSGLMETLESSLHLALAICDRDRCRRNASSLPPAMAEEAENAMFRLEKIDLSEILSAHVKLWRRVLRKEIEISTGIDRSISINADSAVLSQIFTNVWLNAIQSMQTVSERANLMVVECKVEGGMCIITIEDNGAGITGEVFGKLFTRGFTTKPTGSGIGISVCRDLAQKMGGSFVLTNGSRMGNGATVTMKFPAIDDEREANRKRRGWEQLNLDLGDSGVSS